MPLRSALEFCKIAPTLTNPTEVLTALQVVSQQSQLSVFAIWQLPQRVDTAKIRLNETIFFHPNVRIAGLWAHFMSSAQLSDTALTVYGHSKSYAVTLTEAMRALKLNGRARLIFEMGRQYGIRDGLYCPFRKWSVFYYSRQVLDLDPANRALLFMAAGCATERMEQLVKKAEWSAQATTALTDREIMVVRLLSHGKKDHEVGAELDISIETVRTHVKNTFKKLKAKNREHAIAVAFRQGLIS